MGDQYSERISHFMDEPRRQYADEGELFKLRQLGLDPPHFLFDFMLLFQLMMKPGSIERETQMHRNSGKELLVISSNDSGSIQELQNANADAVPVHDRHAIKIPGFVTQPFVELRSESSVS